MKKLYIILTILILLLPLKICAAPQQDPEYTDAMQSQLSELPLPDLQTELSGLDPTYTQTFGAFDIENLTQSLTRGEWSWNPIDILKRGLTFFLKELYSNSFLMLQLIVLVLMTALITNLQKSTGKGGAGEIAFFACYIMVIGVAVKGFITASASCTQFIDSLVSFIKTFVPAIIALIATSGGITSATVLQPILLGAAQIISLIIKDLLMPLLFVSTAVGIINNLSDRFQVERFVSLIQNIIKWTLGILLTVFVGIITLQSIAMPAVDGIAAKTAKYAVGSFVPVVGKVLSDTVEMVVGCSLILKNAFGVAGLIAIVVICFVPLIKILAHITIFGITSAVVEPVADKRLTKCLSHLSSSLTYMFIMMLSLELMFLISIAISITAGSSAAVFAK